MNSAEKMDVICETNEVLILGTNERLIREIGEKTKNLVISDAKTFESVKQARTEIVTLRTSIDKARKSANQTHRDGIAENDLQAKSLTEIVVYYEEPLQNQVKKWQDKKAEEKRIKEDTEKVRITGHTTAINAIRDLPGAYINASSEVVQGVIDDCFNIDIREDTFEEYAIEAQQVLKNTLLNLSTMLASAREREAETKRQKTEQTRLADEQKKLDKQREEQETENKRLQAAREKLERQQRKVDEKVESERLELEDKIRQEEEEKQRLQREEALRPDKEKLIAFADQIRELHGPEVTSDEAIIIIECALDGLSQAANIIHQQCEFLSCLKESTK